MNPKTQKETERLEKILSAFMEGGVSPEEFMQVIDTIVLSIKELKESLLLGLNEKKSELTEYSQNELQKIVKNLNEYSHNEVQEIAKNLDEHETEMYSLMEKDRQATTSEIEQAKTNVQNEIERVKKLIPTIPDISDVRDKLVEIEEALATIPRIITQEPEAIRDALELLAGDERLDVSTIKGLDEKLQVIDKKASRTMTPAKSYQIYTKDATAQCDGSTKTFTVGGSHRGIIGVFGTQFPQIFRPIIDYTETAVGILLTSEVSAPLTGQTLIIQYLK